MTPQEFKQLVLPMSRQLYEAALRITGNASDAEDAVQDIMARLWTRRSEMKAVDSFRAYALAMVRNRAFDMVGYNGRYTGEDVVTPERLAASNPEMEAEERDDVRHLLEAIESLPPNQAMVMRMRHIDGLEPAEIESLTGLSPVNVRVLLSRARTSIRNYFTTLQNHDNR